MSGLKKKIFLADDDLSILDALTIMLKDIGGYEVVTTTDGESLLQLNRHEIPDLFLLDLWMSGLDGREICKELKKKESTRDVPVIIFSANRDIQAIALEAGADDFVAKPFQMNDLLNKVRKLLNNTKG